MIKRKQLIHTKQQHKSELVKLRNVIKLKKELEIK